MLVIGGARSGKSRYAQELVEASGRAPLFIATAQAFDGEMEQRIARHLAARDERWHTLECPYDLRETLVAATAPATAVLVDCLTLWLSNLLLRGDDIETAATALAGSVPKLRGPAVFVSNEVGSGIVPDSALGRQFRDAQGRLNQEMAKACDAVVLVAAGLPLQLKPAPAPTVRL